MDIRSALKAMITSAALLAVVACGNGDDDEATRTVGGTVNGSAGAVVLQMNGADSITTTGAGAFTFATPLSSGATYNVTVASSDQNCRVVNGSGTVGGSDITDVVVNCTTVVRSASMNGASENPPVTTAASGRGAVIVDPATRGISGGLTFSGLTPIPGGHHIHQAPAGNPTANGPVIIGLVLSPDGASATVPAGTVLTDAQYAALLAGELYMNVHTAANPGGEIRGQLTVRNVVTAGLATLSASQEVPPNASTATGRATLLFDAATREVVSAYVTHNVVNATVAHIHTGAPGVAGPPDVATLTAGTFVYTAPTPLTLTPQNVIDLAAGNLYFNVHSPTYPAGEIRGQIVVQ